MAESFARSVSSKKTASYLSMEELLRKQKQRRDPDNIEKEIDSVNIDVNLENIFE
jgi:hypothetical protein